MPTTKLNELIPMLQVAIGPVILISGVGLLLLSLTNRFGRAVDRSRQLIREMREADETNRPRLADQVAILFRRARLIQISIILATVSVLFAAMLIITLFFMALLKSELAVLISLLFICCLTSLIVSLFAFIMDIHLSLKALKLELDHQTPVPAEET
jgi:Na+/melibiose symporter-like transporter